MDSSQQLAEALAELERLRARVTELEQALSAYEAIEAMRRGTLAEAGERWRQQQEAAGSGYGATSMGGRFWLAHRLSYFAANGVIDPKAVIRHHCDNPACVNPAHLIAGTIQDNSDDAVARGLTERGSARYNAKLTEKDIPVIRAALLRKISVTQLARKYSVSRKLIHVIRNRSRWRHVE